MDMIERKTAAPEPGIDPGPGIDPAPGIRPGTTLNEIVERHPTLLPILDRHGFDTCCGGGETLEAAARRIDVDLQALLGELEREVRADSARPPDAGSCGCACGCG